jgi:peptide/nickel transport system permease protein
MTVFDSFLPPDAPSPTITRDDLRGRLTADRRAMLAFALLALLILASLAGPLLYHVDPDTLDLAHAGAAPAAAHPLGTDESGRDVLSRLLAGGRVSLVVGFAAVLCALLVGITLGAVAGLGGRRTDAVVMRFTDAVLAIPTLFLVIAALTFFTASIPALVIAIGATSWMGLARLVRGELLTLREQPFVEASRALGARPWQLFVRHSMPHLLPSVAVNATFGIGTAILMESALSFLGLGVQPPRASWGNMLSNAQSYLYTTPWLAIYPGALILVTVVAVNVLGDAIRDVTEPVL